LDRNAGIEYFDSPIDNKDTYDAYVIDCVPERQDLGCLQLITSTSNLDEVRNLLDVSLDQMGLSRSRRNAEFLMEHLKALSGRLAIRLTGEKAPTSELIALAFSHANCREQNETNDCWVSLDAGFIIPVDDIRDLLPPLSSREDGEDEQSSRPDLIYVSTLPRKGLLFRFLEVKYRRHLRVARSPGELEGVRRQIESLRKRWDDWYCQEGHSSVFRAVRRAKLARVLRFYADKARRHYLPVEEHRVLTAEIDRMIEKGEDYIFAEMQQADRGWVFCPEYSGATPLEISPVGWDTRIFLFGPSLLPDSDLRRDSIGGPPMRENYTPADASAKRNSQSKERDSDLKSVEGINTIPEPPAPGEGSGSILTESSINEAVPSICLGTDTLTGIDVRWSLTVKGNPHLLVAGLPGMGKTTCLLKLCKQMLTNGVRPIVFSYHQDIDEKLEHLVGSVRFIDFHGLGFNPL
jgi:hypothetical protein